jgi:hypothetical protein
MTLELEREIKPTRGRRNGRAWVHLTEGTNSSLEVVPGILEVLAALDGARSLDAAVKSAAKRLGVTGDREEKLRRGAVRACRALLELGALEFSAKPS